MKGKYGIVILFALLCLPAVMAGETAALSDGGRAIERLADRLDSISPYRAQIEYAVALPMADDDVIYNIDVASAKDAADPLLGVDYLIDWQLPKGEEEAAKGFTAYFRGHLYRYRDKRLQEYHYGWDSIPFQTPSGGIHRNAQFASLLPSAIAAQLRAMHTDTTYTISLTQGKRLGAEVAILNATRRLNGVESQQLEMVFDNRDGRPLQMSSLYNPGMLGEQEVRASYSYPAGDSLLPPADETALLERYPDVFDRYRESNYSVENLRGEQLPGFALLTTTRERYLHNRGDEFASPMIIAMLDPQVASTPQTIATLREAVDALPRQTGLILAFNSNDVDLVEPMAGQLRPGEAHLISARSLIRDCGVSSFPAILLVDRTGRVGDVILGVSSDLFDRLLQGGALLK